MKYREIVFMQGDDARYPLKMIEKGYHHKVFDYLIQWENGDGEIHEDCP